MAGDVEYLKGNMALVDGVMIPVGGDRMTPAEITKQIKNVVAMQYNGTKAELIGMTMLEAAIYSAAKQAAEGNLEAFGKLCDRLLGKPIQQTITATGTLRDFLDQIVQEAPIDVTPVRAESAPMSAESAPMSAEDL